MRMLRFYFAHVDCGVDKSRSMVYNLWKKKEIRFRHILLDFNSVKRNVCAFQLPYNPYCHISSRIFAVSCSTHGPVHEIINHRAVCSHICAKQQNILIKKKKTLIRFFSSPPYRYRVIRTWTHDGICLSAQCPTRRYIICIMYILWCVCIHLVILTMTIKSIELLPWARTSRAYANLQHMVIRSQFVVYVKKWTDDVASAHNRVRHSVRLLL